MRKLFIPMVLLILSVIALGPSQGEAFNSGTHIYIAERVFPFALNKINLNYGSIAPDLAMYVPEGNWTLDEAFLDTHYYYIYLPYTWWKPAEKAFAKGWQTHNEIWGADYYAHVFLFDGDQSGYVIARAEDLADLLSDLNIPVDSELAHFAIEVAIDLLLARYHEPGLGLKLLWATKYRSQQDLNLMVETLVNDDEPSAQTLEAAENNFRSLVIDYATALALPDPLRMFAISELGVQVAAQMNVTVTPYQVWEILRAAMYLCQNPNDMGVDYMEVIKAAIEGIREYPGLIR